MRFAFAQGHNRWFVACSSIFMVVFAIFAGVGRVFAERFNEGSRVQLFPGDFWEHIDLNVILLLLIVGMAANVGVAAIPAGRPWAVRCLLVASAILLVLAFVAVVYGLWILRLFSHSVSGGS